MVMSNGASGDAAQKPPKRVRLLIAEWCEFLGMTQKQLSKRSGIAESVISRLAKDERDWNARHLMAISTGLDIPPHYLIMYDPGREVALIKLLSEVDPMERPLLARLIREKLSPPRNDR